MNAKVLAGIIIGGTLLLGACTLVNPRTSPTKPLTPTVTGITGGVVTDTVSTTPTTANVESTPAQGGTSTSEITPTLAVTPTTEVTTTSAISASAEETPTASVTTPVTETSMVATSVKTLVVRVRSLLIRNGPGTTYRVIGRYYFGRVLKVTGANADGTWYRVLCANGRAGDCWVSGDPRYVIARK